MRRAGESRPTRFAVEPAPLDQAPGLLVRGAVDIYTAPELAAAIDEAIMKSRGPFVVNLCNVEFLDSSAVNVLVRAPAVLGQQDRQLVVICPCGPARRIFEVAGIDDLLVLFDSQEQVAASLRPAA
jgi:anti-sigma B factor antagonist